MSTPNNYQITIHIMKVGAVRSEVRTCQGHYNKAIKYAGHLLCDTAIVIKVVILISVQSASVGRVNKCIDR